MAGNNLYTLSYFRKRLNDANYNSNILIEKYPEKDSRYWTINILPNSLNIHCTCFLDNEKNCSFLFVDGKQKIKLNRTISTKSMMIIIEFLDELLDK